MSGKQQLSVTPEIGELAAPDLHSPGWKILRKDAVTFETSLFTPKSPASRPMPPPMTNYPSAPNLSSPKRSSSPSQPPQPTMKTKKKANSNPSLATTPASLNLPGWKILTKEEAPETRAYSAPASPSAGTTNGLVSSPSASSASSSGWKILQKEPATHLTPSLSKSMDSSKVAPGPMLFNPFTIPEETVLMARSPSGTNLSIDDRKAPQSSSLKLPAAAAKRVPRASRSSSSPSFPMSPKSPKGLFASTSSSPSSTSTSNSPSPTSHTGSTSLPSPTHSHSFATPSSSPHSHQAYTPSPSSTSSTSSHFFPPSSISLPSDLSLEEKRFLISTRRAQLWIALRSVSAYLQKEQVKLIFDYVAPQLLLAVLGGYGGFRVYRKTCDVYHPETRSWESKLLPKMPVKTSRSVGCCVGDKLFVIGSSPPNLTYVFALDLTESHMTWRTLPEPNFARRDVSLCVFQNEVYVFGGATTEEGSHVCEAYNFATNSWRTLKSTLNVSDGAACVVGEMIYLVGGSDPRSPIPGPGVRYCQSYRPSTGKWADVSPMITKRKGLASCVYNNKIYIFGGYDLQSFRALSSCECYDPLTNSWTQLPSMPEPRIGAVACTIGDSIYLSGGRAESLCALGTCLQFDVKLNAWSFMSPLPRSRCSHGACLIEF